MRLIDADKLLEGEHFILKCKSEFGITEMDIFRREVIENAPTIDDLSEYSDKLWKQAYERGKAEERPTGHWFLLDECSNEGVYCSNCRKKVYRVEYANQKVKSNYCPNCGAKMTKGAEND